MFSSSSGNVFPSCIISIVCIGLVAWQKSKNATRFLWEGGETRRYTQSWWIRSYSIVIRRSSNSGLIAFLMVFEVSRRLCIGNRHPVHRSQMAVALLRIIESEIAVSGDFLPSASLFRQHLFARSMAFSPKLKFIEKVPPEKDVQSSITRCDDNQAIRLGHILDDCSYAPSMRIADHSPDHPPTCDPRKSAGKNK